MLGIILLAAVCAEPLYQQVRDPLTAKTELVECCGCGELQAQLDQAHSRIAELETELAVRTGEGDFLKDLYCRAAQTCEQDGYRLFERCRKRRVRGTNPFAKEVTCP